MPLNNGLVIVWLLFMVLFSLPDADEDLPEPSPRCSPGPGRMAPRPVEKVRAPACREGESRTVGGGEERARGIIIKFPFTFLV